MSAATPDDDFDEDPDFDEQGDDEDWPGGVCGRWRNGKLAPWSECLLAGTEDCDWECPFRITP